MARHDLDQAFIKIEARREALLKAQSVYKILGSDKQSLLEDSITELEVKFIQVNYQLLA